MQQKEVGEKDDLKENFFVQDSSHMLLIALGFVVLIAIGLVIYTIAASVKNHKADGKYFHKEVAHQMLMIGLVLVTFSIASFAYIHTADGKSLNKSVALLYKIDNHDHFSVRSVSMSHPGSCVSKVFAAHNDVS